MIWGVVAVDWSLVCLFFVSELGILGLDARY